MVLLELPETLQFVSTKSSIIEEERKALKSGTISPTEPGPGLGPGLGLGPISGTANTTNSMFSHSGTSTTTSSHNNHPHGSNSSSSSGGGMSSGGLSTIGLGREGREKAHSAVKKLFSSSASSFSSPVMKPDSLMKKLTNRGGTVSPVVTHVPQVTPAADGTSLLLSSSGGSGGGDISQLRSGGCLHVLILLRSTHTIRHTYTFPSVNAHLPTVLLHS